MNEDKLYEIIGKLYAQLNLAEVIIQQKDQAVKQAEAKAEQFEQLLKQTREQEAKLRGLFDSTKKANEDAKEGQESV